MTDDPARPDRPERDRRYLELIRLDIEAEANRQSEIMSEIARLHGESNRIDRTLKELRNIEIFLMRRLGIETTSATVASALPGGYRGEKAPHADFIEGILRESGPMKTAEIVATLEEMGRHLPKATSNRHSVVYSAMLRRPRTFARLGNGVWGLVDPKERP